MYADGILLSNLLGNGATFTPRWGLVTPEEIERVDVLYGPFSAAYPGNSVGAVVDYVTRMPEELEVHARLTSFGQDFEIYDSRRSIHAAGRRAPRRAIAAATSPGGSTSTASTATASRSSFANKLVSSGVAGSAGTPVTGAVADRNPRNQDWLILGSTTQIHTMQDHGKAKLSYDFSPTLRASYTLGVWHNDAVRNLRVLSARCRPATRSTAAPSTSRPLVQRDARGLRAEPWRPHARDARAVCQVARARPVRLGNRRERLRLRGRHHALAHRRAAGSRHRWRRTHRRQGGTGWRTLALRGTWRPQGVDGAHVVDFGYQLDANELQTLVSNTADWIDGAGDRSLLGICAARLSCRASTRRTPGASPTTGARRSACACEHWHADDGAIANATSTLHVRRTHRDSCLAKGRARLATHSRLGAEGVGRTRRAHAHGVRAVPGFDAAT